MSRQKILAAWRAQYSGLCILHREHIAAGRKDEAPGIVRKMKQLEKAIKGFSEEKMGEFRVQVSRRDRAAESDRN